MPDHFHGIIIIDNTLTAIDNESKKLVSLFDIIGKFKSFASRKIRELLSDEIKFEWQKSFYDRIIRNEKELYNIRKYIQENPLRGNRKENQKIKKGGKNKNLIIIFLI